MKKIFLSLVVFSLSFSFGVAIASETDFANLEKLKMVLGQAKEIQKKIIADEEAAAKYPYKIKLLTPQGGGFKGGDTLKISWDGLNSGLSRINIYLSTTTDSTLLSNPGILIGRNVPIESVFYPWTIPENMTGNYYVFIKNPGKYRLGAYSGSLTISAPDKINSLIKITSIKGGETFITGRNSRIIWKEEDGMDRFVNLRLVKADSLATSTASIPAGFDDYILTNTGGLDWKIPSNVATGEYKLKIFGVNTDCPYCMEPQAKNLFMTEKFKIINEKELPKKITLFSPTGESDIFLVVNKDEKTEVKLIPVASTTATGQATTTYEWSTTTKVTYSTSTEKISWFSPFDIDSIDVYLRSVPSGRITLVKNNVESILSGTSSSAEMVWTPKLTDPGEKVFVRICRTGTNNCDESKKPFSVFASTTEQKIEPAKQEPNTPEYNVLRDIVNKIKDLLNNKITGEKKEAESTEDKKEAVSETSTTTKSYLPYYFDKRLSLGMENDDGVRALQEALAKEGLFNHEVTGKFGEVTLQAVKDFQAKYELDPSGSVGPGTQAKLNELYSMGAVTSDNNIWDCGTDWDCFLKSAKNCESAKMTASSKISILGVTTTAESLLQISKTEDKCNLYNQTQKMSAVLPAGTSEEAVNQSNEAMNKMTGQYYSCKFATSDLYSVLERWSKGVWNTVSECNVETGKCKQGADFENAECSGAGFSQ